jgi:hypothetical protein
MTDLTPEQNAAMAKWDAARKAIPPGLKALTDAEMLARKEAFALIFPKVAKGTHYVDLPGGWRIKGVRKVEYKLDPEQVDAMLDALKGTGNEGTFLADRLVKWKAELSVTEYEALTSDTYKKIVDRILTTKDASPEFSLVSP